MIFYKILPPCSNNLQLTLSFSPDDGLIHTADDRKRELLSSSFSHLFFPPLLGSPRKINIRRGRGKSAERRQSRSTLASPSDDVFVRRKNPFRKGGGSVGNAGGQSRRMAAEYVIRREIAERGPLPSAAAASDGGLSLRNERGGRGVERSVSVAERGNEPRQLISPGFPQCACK